MVDENIESCQFLSLMDCEFHYNIRKKNSKKSWISKAYRLTKKSKIGEFYYAPKWIKNLMVDENIESCQFLSLMDCEFHYNIRKK